EIRRWPARDDRLVSGESVVGESGTVGGVFEVLREAIRESLTRDGDRTRSERFASRSNAVSGPNFTKSIFCENRRAIERSRPALSARRVPTTCQLVELLRACVV